jgi:hypothetical protein
MRYTLDAPASWSAEGAARTPTGYQGGRGPRDRLHGDGAAHIRGMHERRK